MSVITPLGVDTIAMPKPLFILFKLSALENILLPGLDTRSIVLITGFPELYSRLITKTVSYTHLRAHET